MVKTGIYYAYWTKNWSADFIPFVKKVKKLGFDVLEINAGTLAELSQQELENLGQVAQDCSISLSCCIGLPDNLDPSSTDFGVRKKAVGFLNQIAKAMKLSKIKKLSGIIYSSWPGKLETRGVERAQVREWSISSIREAIKTAEDYDLVYNLEVVNRFEQFIINTAQEGVDFIREVESPNLKILLDSFHMNIEENSFWEAILTAGNHLGHFHVGENNRRPPGTGILPWDEMFRALKEISYDQWIVMEPFISPGGEVGRDISVYRDIMPGVDKDLEAEKACNFIKNKIELYKL